MILSRAIRIRMRVGMYCITHRLVIINDFFWVGRLIVWLVFEWMVCIGVVCLVWECCDSADFVIVCLYLVLRFHALLIL